MHLEKPAWHTVASVAVLHTLFLPTMSHLQFQERRHMIQPPSSYLCYSATVIGTATYTNDTLMPYLVKPYFELLLFGACQ